jgi:hypothetical protein
VSLLVITLCLVLMSLLAHYTFLPEPLRTRLDLNSEGNVPAWFSSSALLCCSILVASIAQYRIREGAPYARHWTLLAVIFLLLSLDEAVSLHEMLIKPLRSALNVGGFLHFAWVIPGAAFVLVFALAYLKFFRDLPSRSRRLFAIAGILYIWGALGMEMIDGYIAVLYKFKAPIYVVMTTIEEGCEMLGISIFIYALIRYAASLPIAAQAFERTATQESEHHVERPS